jgi:hypothetical protein
MQLNAAVQEIRARQVFAGRAHLMPINALAFPLQLPPHSFTAPPPSSVPSLSLSLSLDQCFTFHFIGIKILANWLKKFSKG